MQSFIGYKLKHDPVTNKIEKDWKECVANSRKDAAIKMGVPISTVTLAR